MPYFIAFGVGIVDEDKGLLCVYSCVAMLVALPAALLYEPACGNFYHGVAYSVRWYMWVLCVQQVVLCFGDGGVLEEAAGIAYLLRVRELAGADVHDRIGNGFYRKVLNAHGLQLLRDGAVADVEFWLLAELVYY